MPNRCFTKVTWNEGILASMAAPSKSMLCFAKLVTSHFTCTVQEKSCWKQICLWLPLVPGSLITLSTLKILQLPSAAGRFLYLCSTIWMFFFFPFFLNADGNASHFPKALNSLLKCNLGSILFHLLCSSFNKVLKWKVLKNYLKE